jgi:hypothetical protein
MLVQVKKPEDSKYPWDYYQTVSGQRVQGFTLSKPHIPGL